jgi:hypothetical protein
MISEKEEYMANYSFLRKAYEEYMAGRKSRVDSLG